MVLLEPGITTEEISAYATVAAVIVALAGPLLLDRYRSWRHAPKLALAPAEQSLALLDDETGLEAIALSLSNGEDRFTGSTSRSSSAGPGSVAQTRFYGI